jgi:hypothetical protein
MIMLGYQLTTGCGECTSKYSNAKIFEGNGK